MNGAHDMGGEPADPVDTDEHAPSMSERRVDALMQLLRQKPRGFWTTDENRRTIESLAPETYLAAGYYEKWAYAMRGLLIEKGVLGAAEIDRKLSEVKARHGAAAKPKRAKAKAAAKKAAAKKAPAAKARARAKPAAKRGKA